MNSKRKAFGGKSSALENASQIVSPLRQRGTPTQMIEVASIEFDPGNLRDIALRPDDVRNGLDENDPAIERKTAELEEVRELARSIQSQGLINPIRVYRRGDGYILESGQRRYLAHILLDEAYVNASVLASRPRALRASQYVENEQRVRMSLAQRVRGIGAVLAEAGLKAGEGTDTDAVEVLSRELGMGTTAAYRYAAVARGPAALLDAVLEGRITNVQDAQRLAAFPVDLLEQAIEGYVAGTPLAELEVLKLPRPDPVKEAPAVAARGRPPTSIALGKVTKPTVVRGIVRDLLGDDAIPEIDWTDFKAVARVWADVLKKLEQRYA